MKNPELIKKYANNWRKWCILFIIICVFLLLLTLVTNYILSPMVAKDDDLPVLISMLIYIIVEVMYIILNDGLKYILAVLAFSLIGFFLNRQIQKEPNKPLVIGLGFWLLVPLFVIIYLIAFSSFKYKSYLPVLLGLVLIGLIDILIFALYLRKVDFIEA